MEEKDKFLEIMATVSIVFVYCMIWMLLEIMIYGQAENRIVDNIMMVLFVPVIYKAIDK